ncbi:MAG TPA: hypothetical protein VHN13_04745 [Candidatus Tectomicrobia bacterium]|jgi:hypothetical protein|nr:hypothetical protein [Candidatus Tectomicrobia bacterium]
MTSFTPQEDIMDLTELTPEQRTRLAGAVNERVVKVAHPDLAEGWDVWWREDYERFIAQYPAAEQDFTIKPASLEEAAAFIDLLDPTAPTFALFSKGLGRNRYERQ